MRRFVIVILAVSLVVAGLVSWFASNDPDGLERVAEDSGFHGMADDPAVEVMPDYTVPGLDGFLSNALAGIAGVLTTFAVVWLAGKVIVRRKNLYRR